MCTGFFKLQAKLSVFDNRADKNSRFCVSLSEKKLTNFCAGWMRGLTVYLSLSCRFTLNAKKLWVESRHIDCILINEYLFILIKICNLKCQSTTLLALLLDIKYVVLHSINFCMIYAERNFNRGSIVWPDISKSLLETVTKCWKVSLRGSHSPKYGLNKKTFFNKPGVYFPNLLKKVRTSLFHQNNILVFSVNVNLNFLKTEIDFL